MAWQMQFHDVTIGPAQVGPLRLEVTVVGAGQLAQGAAAALNWLIPRLPALQGMPRWPGAGTWAEATGDTVTVRWIKGAAWSAALVGALAGLGTTLVAMGVFDISLIPAVVLGALVTVGVFAALVGWQLVAYLTQAAARVVQPATLAWVGVGLIAVAGLLWWAEGGG